MGMGGVGSIAPACCLLLLAPNPSSLLACFPACSLLARCRLEGRFFDLIDSDSFGAATQFVGAALDAVRWGGLVCLTSTSGQWAKVLSLEGWMEDAGRGSAASLCPVPVLSTCSVPGFHVCRRTSGHTNQCALLAWALIPTQPQAQPPHRHTAHLQAPSPAGETQAALWRSMGSTWRPCPPQTSRQGNGVCANSWACPPGPATCAAHTGQLGFRRFGRACRMHAPHWCLHLPNPGLAVSRPGR